LELKTAISSLKEDLTKIGNQIAQSENSTGTRGSKLLGEMSQIYTPPGSKPLNIPTSNRSNASSLPNSGPGGAASCEGDCCDHELVIYDENEEKYEGQQMPPTASELYGRPDIASSPRLPPLPKQTGYDPVPVVEPTLPDFDRELTKLQNQLDAVQEENDKLKNTIDLLKKTFEDEKNSLVIQLSETNTRFNSYQTQKESEIFDLICFSLHKVF